MLKSVSATLLQSIAAEDETTKVLELLVLPRDVVKVIFVIIRTIELFSDQCNVRYS